MDIRTGTGRAAAVLALVAVAAAGGCTSAPAPPTPAPSPTARPAPPSTPPTTVAPAPVALPAGVYAFVTTDGGSHLAVLTPGAAAWRYAAPVPAPDIDRRYDEVVARSFDLGWYLMRHRPDGTLWNITADGGEKHLIVTPPKGLEVCSAGYDEAGDRIYYSLSTHFSRRLSVYTARPDGTGRRQVSGVTDAMACTVVWSADGSTMAMTYQPVTDPWVHVNHTVLLSDGTSVRRLTVALPATTRLYAVDGLSADGQRAVVGTATRDPHGEIETQLYLVDLRTRAAVRLVPPLRWSTPASSSAVFDASGLMLVEITTPTKDGGTEVEVGVFDQRGRFVQELPNPSLGNANDVDLWGVVL